MNPHTARTRTSASFLLHFCTHQTTPHHTTTTGKVSIHPHHPTDNLPSRPHPSAVGLFESWTQTSGHASGTPTSVPASSPALGPTPLSITAHIRAVKVLPSLKPRSAQKASSHGTPLTQPAGLPRSRARTPVAQLLNSGNEWCWTRHPPSHRC
ncbi:hypothetical protein K505DRAFT_85378 [Melanomma pulvis-pyrius CBS 109.77]|uniref:Uncharacterized protein n=1 Tax=Melanomma pulvis-pyrius CBS 109.77 TaxID=1314802 RepID=A0A6A6XRC5_9PLEO|nr:hypothetical protein K505DRAFT_85378 [Melanomma pulvis-pyrius CBS 109.77]